MEEEPILKNINNSKYILSLKNRKNGIYYLYKKHVQAFWTMDEIDMSNDYDAFKKLKKEEQHYVIQIISFFSSSDLFIMDNINNNFAVEVMFPECKLFYSIQNFMEALHTQVYNKLLETLIKDENEREFLIASINNCDFIKLNCDWTIAYMNSNISFVKRLLAFICIEIIFFCSSFAGIFYLSSRSIPMYGLIFSNKLISADESLHFMHSILLYKKYIVNKLSYEEVLKIFNSAVSIEIDFTRNTVPISLIGLNADLMEDYIKFVADRGLFELGYPKFYNTKNPFPFMEMISLNSKSNMFERQISEYKKSSVRQEIFNIPSLYTVNLKS